MLPLHALEAIVLVLLLAAVMYGPWQWACTDFARERMFRSRDHLFDIARRGDLAFDDPNYQTIRSEINNMIRFAHGLTWVRLAILAPLARKVKTSKPPIYAAMAEVKNRQVREEIGKLVLATERAAILMVFMKSPLLMALSLVTVLPILIGIIAYLYARHVLADTARDLGGLIQTEAAFADCR